MSVPGDEQRPDRGDQRTPGTPARIGARIPEPDELHRPIAARDRRIQATTTPSFRMSLMTSPTVAAGPFTAVVAAACTDAGKRLAIRSASVTMPINSPLSSVTGRAVKPRLASIAAALATGTDGW